MKPIIGVMGGTSSRKKEIPESTLNLAKELAKIIVRKNAILLTGADPANLGYEKSIKISAFTGAKAGSTTSFPQIINIVRDNKNNHNPPYVFSNENGFSIYTTLGDKRNAITGSTPDIIIALDGGAGTLSEVACAHHCSVPIVFLNSLEILRVKINDESTTLNEHLGIIGDEYHKLGGSDFIPNKVRENLENLLKQPEYSIDCSRVDLAIESAIFMSLKLIDKNGKKGRFPGLKNYNGGLQTSIDDFYRHIKQMK